MNKCGNDSSFIVVAERLLFPFWCGNRVNIFINALMVFMFCQYAFGAVCAFTCVYLCACVVVRQQLSKLRFPRCGKHRLPVIYAAAVHEVSAATWTCVCNFCVCYAL